MAADNGYEEICSKFIEACFKSKDIFSCLYRLNLPKNVDAVDRVQELTDDISNLREKEAELVKELMNVCSRYVITNSWKKSLSSLFFL